MSEGYIHLAERIGKRRAVIDACLDAPDYIADGLRPYGIECVGLPSSSLTDETIEYMMQENDVLLSRDWAFCKRLGQRAILLKRGSQFNHQRVERFGYAIRNCTKKHIKAIVEFETAYGWTDFKVMRGMRMLFTMRRKNDKGWTVREPI